MRGRAVGILYTKMGQKGCQAKSYSQCIISLFDLFDQAGRLYHMKQTSFAEVVIVGLLAWAVVLVALELIGMKS